MQIFSDALRIFLGISSECAHENERPKAAFSALPVPTTAREGRR
jgi:hypothetical protein